MSVPIKYFSSDQTSAPSCTGEVGKCDAILYACLVTGFNTKSISSISVTSNVATVTTSTTHGYVATDIIVISGANESVFNDEFTIVSVPTTDTFTFNVTTANGSATGTISCKIAPLGWTRVYSGTNKSVYRSTDVTGTQLYLRVDDTATYVTKVNMYETMNTVDNGVGATTDLWWNKSNLNTSSTRSWYLVGDSRCFYLMIAFNANITGISLYCFGDIHSFSAYDSWGCIIAGHTLSTGYAGNIYANTSIFDNTGTATTGLYLARTSTKLGPAVSFALLTLVGGTTIGYNASEVYSFPSRVDNGLHLINVYINDSTYKNIRGMLPGLYAPIENVNGLYANKDCSIIANGKTYMAFKSANGVGNYWIDVTGPWRI